MQWSPRQIEALDAVGRWLREGNEQVFRLFGFAGTGKTTLATHLAADLDRVYFAAYTGKAASVMRKNGCTSAETIHRLIYMPAEKSKRRLKEIQERLAEARAEQASQKALARLARELKDEEAKLKQPFFALNPESDVQHADLIIIDECSMVDERMGEDLLSFGRKVLVLGDPAQLPPVRGGGFFTNEKPDIMLDEIHRQAEGNPIIELATRVRQRQRIEPGEYGKCIVGRGTPDRDLVMRADQMLVGTNRKRRECNMQMRKLLGFNHLDPMPVPSDKLVCLRNNHELGILNGTLWTVDDVGPARAYGEDHDIEMEIEGQWGLELTGDDGQKVACNVHQAYFQGTEDDLDYWTIRDAESFDYGYALTTHKAQGSQWPRVFVFNQSGVFKGSAMNWLYTAVTRASEELYLWN